MIVYKKYLAFLFIFILGTYVIYLFTKVSSLTVNDYISNVDSGYYGNICNRNIGTTTLSAKYVPSSYLALINENVHSNQSFMYHKENYSFTSNYVLRIENSEVNDLLKSISSSSQEFQEVVQYFSFGIKDDLFLCLKEDTLLCNFVHFERIYNMAPFAIVNLGFELNEDQHKQMIDSEWSLKFNADNLNLGPLYFSMIFSEQLENPDIKF